MTVAGILGVTHDKEMQEKYHFPLSLMEELIVEFSPDVICGEVHPLSWKLYSKTGDPYGIFGETQDEYPSLIFPLCQSKGIDFVPVNWFEEDVFEEEPFDKFDDETKEQLEKELLAWNQNQLAMWNRGNIPLNSLDYDLVTSEMYEWLHRVNPDVQNVVWTARHYIMLARVKSAIKKHSGQRLLCIHGADHNYWYYNTLKNDKDLELIYPLR